MVPSIPDGNRGVRFPGLGEVFDSASDVFRARFGAIVGITLLIDLPISAAQSWIQGDDPGVSRLLLSGLVGLVGLFSAAATLRIAADHLEGVPDASWTTALADAVRVWPRLAASLLLVSALVLGGTLLLLVPGLWLGVQASWVPWVVVRRGGFGMEAFRASRRLVSGRWWRTLGMLLALLLPAITVILIMALPALLFRESALAGVLLGIPALLASAYYAACCTVVYRSVEPMLESSLVAEAPAPLWSPDAGPPAPTPQP